MCKLDEIIQKLKNEASLAEYLPGEFYDSAVIKYYEGLKYFKENGQTIRIASLKPIEELSLDLIKWNICQIINGNFLFNSRTSYADKYANIALSPYLLYPGNDEKTGDQISISIDGSSNFSYRISNTGVAVNNKLNLQYLFIPQNENHKYYNYTLNIKIIEIDYFLREITFARNVNEDGTNILFFLEMQLKKIFQEEFRDYYGDINKIFKIIQLKKMYKDGYKFFHHIKDISKLRIISYELNNIINFKKINNKIDLDAFFSVNE